MTYNGIVHGLDETEYHGLPGLSSTGAKKLLQSPAHYQHYITAPREEKDEFDVGHLVHSKVLGVGAQVAIYPDDVLAKNGAISTNAAHEFAANARAEGKVPMKRAAANTVNRMAESVLAHDDARTLFENGRAEVSMFATDPATGVPMRGRLDYLRETEIVDLKTTSGEASEHGFAKSVYDYSYDLQFGWYEHLYDLITGETPRWMWAVVESSAPFITGVFVLGTDEAEMGRKKARIVRERYQRCYEAGRWPSRYQNRTLTTVGIVQAPWWAVTEYEALLASERQYA
jgi:hypothetical protein